MKIITQTLIAGLIAAAIPLASCAAPTPSSDTTFQSAPSPVMSTEKPLFYSASTANAGVFNAGSEATTGAAVVIPTLQPATLRPARADSHKHVPGVEKVMVRKASIAATHGEFVRTIPQLAPHVAK